MKTATEVLERGTPRAAPGNLGRLTAEERRRYAGIPEKVDYVRHPSFSSPAAEERLFGQEAPAINVPAWTHFPEVPDDVPITRSGRTALRPREETSLFLRYNYARYRLSRLLVAQQQRESTTRARQMIRWYQQAMNARADLVRANMALVLAMAKRTRIPNVEFAELISEGNMALLRSVEKFDVSRGFKFSTYACRAILKGFNRLATKTGRYRAHFPTEFDPELERSDYDVRKRQVRHEDSVDCLREILACNRADLTAVERTVIMERFGIGAGEKPRTLADVGRLVGLTNERVRQIQNLALRKLRLVLAEEYLAA